VSGYEALAGAYDVLMEDAAYRRRADFLTRRLQRAKAETVLDLGCGTGTIACLLAEQGFRVTAVDRSPEMLTEAEQKAQGLENRPFFLCQPMERLRLLEPVDAVVSTLDALNYLTRPKAVQETFRRVRRCLAPGGVFLFDVNTPYKLRQMNGQVWLDETEDVYCVWRTEFSERTKVCTYWVDLFIRTPVDVWRRSGEEHRERAYEMDELRQWLTEAGFRKIRVTGDLAARPPKPGEDRWQFEAR